MKNIKKTNKTNYSFLKLIKKYPYFVNTSSSKLSGDGQNSKDIATTNTFDLILGFTLEGIQHAVDQQWVVAKIDEIDSVRIDSV